MFKELIEDIPPDHRRTVLRGLSCLNFIIGMNGSGKSTFLRNLAQNHLVSENGVHVACTYIEPERGGSLRIEPNAINRSRQGSQSNQSPAFRQEVLSEFVELHRKLLLELVENKSQYPDSVDTADFFLKSLNDFLPGLKISFESNGNLKVDVDGRKLSSNDVRGRGLPHGTALDALSSGELEAISLGIKILNFAFEKVSFGNDRILLIDSPDAHFHPDLQRKFSLFVFHLAKEHGFQTIISTHSTAMLDLDMPDTRVTFVNKRSLKANSEALSFIEPSEQLNSALPIFGAHPLSQVFNNKPILLVEGEDDVRIWEQAYRSSLGNIRFHPCSVDSIENLNLNEELLDKILPTIYEDPKAFSLRDRDDVEDESIENLDIVCRARLSCRAAENLILANETLSLADTDFSTIMEGIEKWLQNNSEHRFFNEMVAFKEGGFNRKRHNLKKLRNILLSIMAVSKPWEVLVGQSIAKCVKDGHFEDTQLADFLGDKMVSFVIEVST